MKLALIAAPSAALLVTAAYSQQEAPSAPSSSAPRKCFNFQDVTAFKSIDADTIRIETRNSGKFDLDLGGPKCAGLDKATDLSIKSAPSYPLCVGDVGRGRLGFGTTSSKQTISCSISKMDAVADEPAKAN